MEPCVRVNLESGKVNYSTYTISDKSFYRLLKYKNCIGVSGGVGVIFDPRGNIIYSYVLRMGKKWIIKKNGLDFGTLGLSSIKWEKFGKGEMLILGESKQESFPSYQTWNWYNFMI